MSPNDESRLTFAFHHRVGIEQILIVDPDARAVEWLLCGPDAFRPAVGRDLVGITAAALAAVIVRPG